MWSSTIPALLVTPVEPSKDHHYMDWLVLNVTSTAKSLVEAEAILPLDSVKHKSWGDGVSMENGVPLGCVS